VYGFRVQALNAQNPVPPVVVGASMSAFSSNVTPATTPGAPVAPLIGTTAASGAAGGAITATLNWTPPVSTGGAAITGYRVSAVNAAGTVVLPPVAVGVNARQRVFTFTTAGSYGLQVSAVNAVGEGPLLRSAPVLAQ
jgi:hypothetical protein